MRRRARMISLLMAILLASAASTAVMAQGEGDGQSGEVPVNVEVGQAPDAGLSWSIAVNSNFPPVASSFETQTTSGSLTATVEDTRGTEAGWTLTISAGDFTGQDVSTRTIPIGNFVINPGAVNVVAGQRSPLPTVNTVVMSSSPQALMSAPAGAGAGRYSVILTGVITIPGNTLVDVYATTITVDLSAAPWCQYEHGDVLHARPTERTAHCLVDGRNDQRC